MTSNLFRSLTDIQNQADFILNGDPSIKDIEDFQKYAFELRKYILKHSSSTEVADRLHKLPQVIDSGSASNVGFLGFLMTGPLSFMFKEKEQISAAKVKVAEHRSIFSSIEFIIKSEA